MTKNVEEVLTISDPAARHGERRRPGRRHEVSPNLLPLLRRGAAQDYEIEQTEDHGLASATGILVSLLLSFVIWAAMFGILDLAHGLLRNL